MDKLNEVKLTNNDFNSWVEKINPVEIGVCLSAICLVYTVFSLLDGMGKILEVCAGKENSSIRGIAKDSFKRMTIFTLGSAICLLSTYAIVRRG